MIRISTIFIAICMVLVAASLGLVLHAVAGFSGTESAIVALTALTFLILYNAVSMRLRDRSDVGGQIADLSRGTADLARQVAEFGPPAPPRSGAGVSRTLRVPCASGRPRRNQRTQRAGQTTGHLGGEPRGSLGLGRGSRVPHPVTQAAFEPPEQPAMPGKRRLPSGPRRCSRQAGAFSRCRGSHFALAWPNFTAAVKNAVEKPARYLSAADGRCPAQVRYGR
jgi:cyclic-di-GMP phosphodiesterase TipF (flagellum assembly factor)